MTLRERFLAWLHGRCTSHFTTAFDEHLRCELPAEHRGPHRANVECAFERKYRYEWSYGPRRPSNAR